MTNLVVEELDIEQLAPGSIQRFWLKIVSDSFTEPISIPVLVAKGVTAGPCLGLTAALHGNELNGIPVIQQLFKEIDPQKLRGNIIGVPVVNIGSFFRKKRRFSDNVDLNHIMPGKAKGNSSQIYAYNFFEKVIRKIDYLVDLHTASFGRINSYYVRADMDNKTTEEMAMMQNPEIILHNPPMDGTLRGAAESIGIPSITLELGDPNIFQQNIIDQSLKGVYNVLVSLDMIDGSISHTTHNTIHCRSSKWMYTRGGGLLKVLPEVSAMVKKGDLIALQENIFGDVIETYYAPADGVVIGKSVSPVNSSGGRILHLGLA
jgi:predicted deacylase